MNREEAIEVYNGLINTKIKEAFEFFAPELRKINEEEIRKDLIGGLMWQRDNLKSEGPHDNNLILPGFCLTVGKHLTYLEKQKDASKAIEAVDRIDKYIDEHLANAHDMKDSNPDKKYYRGWDDALGKMAGILQDVYSNEKRKEQKAIPIPPPCWESAIQEQKPNSTENMPYITDEHFFEREPADSFKYKLAEYMTKCCTKKEGPYGYEYSISAESILKMAEEELLKRGVVQKPAEGKYYSTDSGTTAGVEGQKSNIEICPHTKSKSFTEVYMKGWNDAMASVKPAEWSEEDDAYRIESIKLLEDSSLYESCPNLRQETIEWLKQLPKVSVNSEQVSINSEWSEEDELMRTVIIQTLERFGGRGTTGMQIDWLKSLRPQPKAELTLLDENIIDAAVAFVEQNDHFNCWGGIDKHTVIKALRSLRPSWKPSEEQMEAMEFVIKDYREDGCIATANYLQEILDQIKKL